MWAYQKYILLFIVIGNFELAPPDNRSIIPSNKFSNPYILA